jgi:dihydrofolate reductase
MSLIYSMLASLDGYIEDADGNFGWAAPDEEVHRFVNDLERGIDTYLYGRRMYDTMVYWETADATGHGAHIEDYAQLWRATDKVVYSRSLDSAASERTRIEREFDADAVRALKATHDVSVGGPELAAHALRAGLVDGLHLFLAPVIVGSGKRALPADVALKLELVDERRFAGGFVHLHYLVLGAANQG